MRSSGFCAANIVFNASNSASDFGFGCASRPGTATASAKAPIRIVRFIITPSFGLLLVALLHTFFGGFARGGRGTLHRQGFLIMPGGLVALSGSIRQPPQINQRPGFHLGIWFTFERLLEKLLGHLRISFECRNARQPIISFCVYSLVFALFQ